MLTYTCIIWLIFLDFFIRLSKINKICTLTYNLVFFFCFFLLTVDAAGLVALIGAVVNLVALLGAVYAGTVAALELIGTARQQGCRRKTHGYASEN